MTGGHRVVIVGGGFAGLEAAKGLGGAAAQVTLVDRANHHLFQPLLYQVATAALSPGDIAQPIRKVLRRAQNVDVLLGDAAAVEPSAKILRLRDGTALAYDTLILAPGARHAYFAHPEWEALAPGLKTIEDALEVRRRILLAFERAERAATAEERRRDLTFVVVGGGPTGVEVAGAIAEITRFALRRDFRHIDSRDASVLLLEGGPRLLTTYPPSLSARAERSLRALGVEVRTETLVTGLEPGVVRVGETAIATETVIWAAGNQASPLLRSLGVALDPQGRVPVEADLTTPGRPDIFVLGDAAAFPYDARYRLLPGTAPVAMQQGRYAARAIRRRLSGRAVEPFRYADKGQLAVIGRGQAVADLAGLRLGGAVAWLTWIFIHIYYLIGFANRVLVLFQWAWSYVTFERGARLITREWRPEDAAGP